jgi:hypothetical protein
MKNTFLDRFEDYFPLAVQFFFGALSSAYVIYFSRSVSLSKTFSFFIILIVCLLQTQCLKKRISNKYLQFSVYFFVNFVFFTFIIPVFIKEMNTHIFLYSGIVSFFTTLSLLLIIYSLNPSTRKEIHIAKIIGILSVMYAAINLFYFLKRIPPVPLVLDSGIVACNVAIKDNKYIRTYVTEEWYIFSENIG